MNISVLIRGISFVMWMLLFGAVALVVIRASRGKPMRSGTLVIIVFAVLAILVSTVSAGLVFIQPNERGVVITAVAPGYRAAALQPGINWIIPFVESVVTYPISRQTYTMSIAPSEGRVQGDDSITARTADGQEIYMDASVIYQIDPNKVIQVHIQWQNRYEELVRAQARGIIRDMVSKYGVEEVYSTKRDELVKRIYETLQVKLEDNGLMLVDFVLRNITFSPEYSASVEQKQIAEQQAQQAKLIVEQKKQEAEQARQTAQGRADAAVIEAKGRADARIIEADAEAKALELIAKVIRDNPSLLNYQYITKLSPTIQTLLLPSNAPFILPSAVFPNSGN